MKKLQDPGCMKPQGDEANFGKQNKQNPLYL